MSDLDEVLDEIEEYLDDRADCEVTGDPPDYRPNKAMRLLWELREARRHA